jgi:hypothetical protein
MSYQDAFDSAVRAIEIAEAQREAAIGSIAKWTEYDVLHDKEGRREQFLERIIDHAEELQHLLVDLLDALKDGNNDELAATLQKRVSDFAASIAEVEESWHD